MPVLRVMEQFQRLAHYSSSTVLAYEQLPPRIFIKHVDLAEADSNTSAKTAAQHLYQSVVRPMNGHGLSYWRRDRETIN